TLKPKGISGDVDQIARLPNAECETDHLTHVYAHRSVTRQRAGNEQLLAVPSVEDARFEWSQADRASTEPISTGLCCVGHADSRQQGGAGSVEIIKVLVVAQQDSVEFANLFH